jgi:hypothetical protein
VAAERRVPERRDTGERRLAEPRRQGILPLQPPVTGERRAKRGGAGEGGFTGRRSSGYEQAKAKLCRFEVEEIAVAFGPPA